MRYDDILGQAKIYAINIFTTVQQEIIIIESYRRR